MNISIRVKLFIESNKEANAKRVANRLLSRLDAQTKLIIFESYHKGGFIYYFEIEESVYDWKEVIYFVISKAQNIGYSWIITGSIENEIDLWSNESIVSGINALHISSIKI